MNTRKLLPLNLQFFASDPTEPTDPPVEPNNGGEPEKRFTQADIDRIVKERIDRERKKAEEAIAKEREEAERKKLEEQNEFKSLYEKERAEKEAIIKESEATKLESLKTNLLVNAGYTGEQLERVRKYIIGANEDEIKTSLDELVKDIPPKVGGVDPSVNNPQRQQPQPKDLADEGRSIYERLKAAGKIRR
ncbi:hypothetical protein [Heyndrickxia sporothermodurans]|uniref:hypothetical protein n=1 Tax=Heyndrickxia sporothermodurans TaxID=46224 RepID=UPI002E2395C1|nr:hypothetical protein [Heyndrickxia sporothermodurans]MED3697945.1 hypothetical protein [Heyndrickxia sporothermodurans]